MGSMGLGYGSNDVFLESEFKTLKLNDTRLQARAIKILYGLITNFTSCVKNLFASKKDQRQAYDFFSNRKVKSKGLIDPHFKQTAERINNNSEELLLVIQDSTYINFTHHKAKVDIGRIGKRGNTEQYGIIQHSSLCVTLHNDPLGLIDLQFYDNEAFIGKESRAKRVIKDKRTNYWIVANQQLRSMVKDDSKRLVRVSDRESDFFEYLYDLVKHNELFVIRAFHNRYTGDKTRIKGSKFVDLIDQKPVATELVFELYNAETRALEQACLTIKVLESVLVPAPKDAINKKNYSAIKLNIVKAYDKDRSWILLTNLAVDNKENLARVINCYRMRWHIEDYHKVLKTGFGIEKIYLHSTSEAIKNLLVMIAVCACRLYWITFIGRNSNNKASLCFCDYEWKAIYTYYKLGIPREEPPLQDVVLLIAKLGGYKQTKTSAPPGIKTMWNALKIFYPIAHMYTTMSNNT